MALVFESGEAYRIRGHPQDMNTNNDLESRIWRHNTKAAGNSTGQAGGPSWVQFSAPSYAPSSSTKPLDGLSLPPLLSVFDNEQGAFPSPLLHQSRGIDGSEQSRESISTSKRPRLTYDEGQGPVESTARDQIVSLGPYPDQDRRKQQEESLSQIHNSHSKAADESRCARCARVSPLARQALSGALELSAAIRKFTRQDGNEESADSNSQAEGDVECSLILTISAILSGVSFIKDLVATDHLRVSAARMADRHSDSSPHRNQTTSEPTSPNSLRMRTMVTATERREPQSPAGVTRPFSSGRASGFTRSMSSTANDRQNWPYAPEPQSYWSFHISHPPLPSPAPLPQPQTGCPMPQGRILPSPSTSQRTSAIAKFPPQSQSPSSDMAAAQTSHLQDLQHQISTKTLALTTLQGEHDRLLAAFSRQQSRYATLEKKTKVSDHEIESLAEDKQRLESQIESLESQAEDLIKGKEESHQQSVASGAQYMQIMAMSSRLQAQGAADMKRWKAEKEGWENEKRQLQERIKELEATIPTRALESPVSMEYERSGDSWPTDTDILSSTSLEILRSEVMRLRARCRDMETALTEFKDEAERLGSAVQQFTLFSNRFGAKTEPVRLLPQFTEPQTPRMREPDDTIKEGHAGSADQENN
ncbi:hypothetical protein FQN53_007622 [Emmonsiellopsis sp. PD_33]|nr:hypothetical protein FQN53_007622 [Emmonsiellopsis sp. PD_33]